MKDDEVGKSPHRRWAEFRFSVIGHLLAAPPGQGDLAAEIKSLAKKKWRHPNSGEMKCFGFSTIESWYYAAKREKRDPVASLRSKPRSDCGESRKIDEKIGTFLESQYGVHPAWTYKLHADNLRAEFGVIAPSYPTVRRYMKGRGLRRQKKPRRKSTADAINHRESREVRSYEVEYVNSLWHLDFHKSELKVVEPDGRLHTPILLGIFDDHSRLACHLQWYLNETAECLTHGFCQALLKRAMPRELMMDNGSAMISAEFHAGLSRLGIVPAHTQVESPYQNGKCEHAWNQVDGRLVAMLENYKDLTLSMLNDATQAWVEVEYNRKTHGETGEAPVQRYRNGRNVGQASPALERLRLCFRREISRTVRRSDGTIVFENIRFEIPSHYRHCDTVIVRFATWDLSFVHLVDFRTGEELCRIYPIDKARNANGLRRSIEDPVEVAVPEKNTEMPPLLRSLIDQHRGEGIVPAYIPNKFGDSDDSK